MKKRLKILNVVGARPNFMKIAALVEEFKKYKESKGGFLFPKLELGFYKWKFILQF